MIVTRSDGVATHAPARAEHFHVVATDHRAMVDLTGAGVVGRCEPHAREAERRQQLLVRRLFVRHAGQLLDQEPDHAVVHVAVAERRPRRRSAGNV